MLTYNLFKTQSMLLSVTSRKGQPDANLHTVQNHEHALVSNKHKGQPANLQTVQNPEHTLVSNKQWRPARCWLTSCSKSRACSCQQQAGRASQMLTYILFETQSMLLSTTSRKGQPDADLHTVQTQSMLLSATSRKGQLYDDLHPVQNPEHALVSYKQEGSARWWLTSC